jgi:hypothetical protein
MDRLGSRANPRSIVPRNRNHDTGKQLAPPEPWYPRFGDWVGVALASIPILRLTPKRWREIKVACGLSDACGCGERKIALNRFGRWVVKPFRRFFAWLRARSQTPPTP